ncbi:MAG: 3-dehydroquinate synthase [Dehalococcoidia bacterium]|nr:3-dehydroquinate synthase [Dehalococcoidia bacterium]
MAPDLIVLVGLSGSGKSTVGRLVAGRLAWDFVDTDTLIERAAGRPIPEIFAAEGEEGFRAREADAVEDACSRRNVVVATGGGAPTTPRSREAIGRGFSVWLSVSPDRAAARLRDNPEAEERPLLADDPAAQLRAQLDRRRPLYETADAAVDVDALTPEQTAQEIVRLWEVAGGRPGTAPSRAADDRPMVTGGGVAAVVRTAGTAYPIVVRRGALAGLGQVCRDLGLGGRAFVLTDTTTGPLFAQRAAAALAEAGYLAERFSIPDGEEHKHLGTVAKVYDWLLAARLERSDFVVCVGGGVVTDLGGFAAATCLRGIDFVHVPTTLLAMADASVGGKTGVDHAMGKNLIGAFAQPRAVVIDPAVLATLSLRQQRAGWAEVIKHGLILDARLVAELEAGAMDPASMMSPELIARSVAIKAAGVSEDEREAGRRTLLNYGHTTGHAIEAVAGFGTYLHGEAVAIGMRVAGRISVEMGMLPAEGLDRQQLLLRLYGLPETVSGLDLEAVLAATASDKKVRAGSVRWVLLEEIGSAIVRADVPDDLVRAALREVLV